MSEVLHVLILVKNASDKVLSSWLEILGEYVDLVFICVFEAPVKQVNHVCIDEMHLLVEQVTQNQFLHVIA